MIYIFATSLLALALEFAAKALAFFVLNSLDWFRCSLGGPEIIAQCHWRHIGCGKLSLDMSGS
jgi:hypothetical protein